MLVDNFNTFRPIEVWLKGEVAARKGESLLPAGETEVMNSFTAEPLNPADIRVAAGKRAHIRVIKVNDGSLLTDSLTAEARVRDNAIVSDMENDIIKLVVYNRYKQSSRPAVGFVKGFGLHRGAIASSVAHDSHNIIAAGSTDIAITTAINEVIMHKGGLSVTSDNAKVIASLPLPLAGLISTEPGEVVARRYSDCDRLAKILGSPLKAPFMTLSFMALPVIPALKLTDKGLFDVTRFSHTELIVE